MAIVGGRTVCHSAISIPVAHTARAVATLPTHAIPEMARRVIFVAIHFTMEALTAAHTAEQGLHRPVPVPLMHAVVPMDMPVTVVIVSRAFLFIFILIMATMAAMTRSIHTAQYI